MAIPVLEFTTKDWINIPPESGNVRITIDAMPPVAASSGFVIFSRPIDEPDGKAPEWRRVKEGEIDNLPQTKATRHLSFDVQPGNYYSFRQQGEAHLLMPGFDEVTVGFQLDAADKPFHNYGGNQSKNGRAAGIIGMTYLKYGA